MTRSPFFPNNIIILTVERPGRIDRYGQSLLNTIATDLDGYIEFSTRYRRNVQGDEVQIDGTLMVEKDTILSAKDIITIDNKNKDTYEIFSIEESRDAGTGDVLYKTYELTKKR